MGGERRGVGYVIRGVDLWNEGLGGGGWICGTRGGGGGVPGTYSFLQLELPTVPVTYSDLQFEGGVPDPGYSDQETVRYVSCQLRVINW